MRELIELFESRNEKIEIVKLKDDHFAPVLSPGLMKLHYGKLAHGYAERFNNNEGSKDFNYAGAWLHNVYFTQFRAPRNNNKPNGPIGHLITQKFKTWEDFKEAFEEEAMKLHGSGWVYLARDGSIKTIHNHAVKSDILVLVDLWEHAYQMDYGSDKKRYLENIWRLMDWSMLNTRWGQAYR